MAEGGHSDYEFRPIKTPEGVLGISMGYERRNLNFSIKLKSFHRDMDPGMIEAAGYRSQVQLVDRSQDIDRDEEISMNQPLVHRGFRFYQSSYDDKGDGAADFGPHGRLRSRKVLEIHGKYHGLRRSVPDVLSTGVETAARDRARQVGGR